MQVLETVIKGPLTAKLMPDEFGDSESPFDYHRDFKLALFHKRYQFPNDDGIDIEKAQHIAKYFNGYSCNVYMYEHGNISLNIGGFSCPWDSGQLGIAYARRDKFRSEKEFQDQVSAVLSEYTDWSNGQVYGYVIEENGEELDSCWGFIGYDHAMKEMQSALEHQARSLLTGMGD